MKALRWLSFEIPLEHSADSFRIKPSLISTRRVRQRCSSASISPGVSISARFPPWQEPSTREH